jgi:translation elongation factor EF-4
MPIYKGRALTEKKMKELIPRQMSDVAIQAAILVDRSLRGLRSAPRKRIG